jgi:DNA repair photolyase
VACYVRHNRWITRGERWGSFVETRTNAAAAYRAEYEGEKNWARRRFGQFGIFLSSSTEPFQPIERKEGITRSVLEAMIGAPPDALILQTHSHHVADYLDLYPALAARTALRFHISIESDIERLPGLPPPASSLERRIAAAAALKAAGLRVVITVSPLFPMRNPDAFFQRLAAVADAVVIDHFIAGDGTADGTRTLRTELPEAMRQVDPRSTTLAYRDFIVEVARRFFPGRVGVNIDGFAGRMLQA